MIYGPCAVEDLVDDTGDLELVQIGTILVQVGIFDGGVLADVLAEIELALAAPRGVLGQELVLEEIADLPPTVRVVVQEQLNKVPQVLVTVDYCILAEVEFLFVFFVVDAAGDEEVENDTDGVDVVSVG